MIKYKKKFIITIETKPPSDFGMELMTEMIRKTVKIIKGYRKSYICTIKETT